MSVRNRVASLALLAAVALPLVVGCQFLVSKTAGSLTYPAGPITDLAPGGSGVDGGYSAGSYDFRATFDVSDDNICEDVIELLSVEIENTNLCITYEVQDISSKGECSEEIYASLDYVI
jgi:hypothetical protein